MNRRRGISKRAKLTLQGSHCSRQILSIESVTNCPEGKMINQEGAVICKRRGHDAGMGLKIGWSECKWCGTWLRELCTIEEDTPPADQQSALGS